MIFLSAESDILLVGQEMLAGFPMETLAQLGFLERVSSFAGAVARLSRDAQLRAEWRPLVSELDPDNLFRGRAAERIQKISPSQALTKQAPLTPRLVSVVVISSHAADSKTTRELRGLSEFGVQKLIVCTGSWSQTAAIDLLNAGDVDGVLFGNKTNFFEQLVKTVWALKKRNEQRQKNELCQLLAHGSTSFLNDPAVWKIIENLVGSLSTTELRLSLDPPGVLLVGALRETELLLICNDDYISGLREIAEITASAKEQRPDIHPAFHDDVSLFAKLIEGSTGLSRIGSWNYCRMPYSNWNDFQDSLTA